MILYRLAKAAFAGFDGEGARRFGGRWNSPGRPAIYASVSPSLAVLEVLVHLDLPPELTPDDYRLLRIEAPDDAPAERVVDPPADQETRQALGDAFLARGQALLLFVPSAIVTQERNAVLNVRHPAMGDVRIVANEPFRFDPRLRDPPARRRRRR